MKIGTSIGERLADSESGSFPPGYDETKLQYWRCPRGSFDLNLPGAGLACLANHVVVEHEDGTITASPSILLRGGGNGAEAHGYSERGTWRDV